MLAKEQSAYGGDLLKTRAGRSRGRPLSTRETMHLVLRSTKATGEWSFRKPRNEAHINRIVDKFSVLYGVRVISMANVGNHLHLQIKLSNRFGFKPFIRAVTAAIAMAITGRNRWSRAKGEGGTIDRTKLKSSTVNGTTGDRSKTNAVPQNPDAGLSSRPKKSEKFWDYRPFTRVVQSFRARLNLDDYIRINRFEGAGYKRSDARFMLKGEKWFERGG